MVVEAVKELDAGVGGQGPFAIENVVLYVLGFFQSVSFNDIFSITTWVGINICLCN